MTNDKSSPQISLPDSVQIISRQMESLQSFNKAFVEANFSSLRAISALSDDLTKSMKPINDSLNEIQRIASSTASEIYKSINQINTVLYESLNKTLFMQYETIYKSSFFKLSQDITDLRLGLYKNQFGVLNDFARVFHSEIVEGQNLALLKLSKQLMNAVSSELSPGIASVVNEMHVSTAKGIATSTVIDFNKSEKKFFDKSTEENDATIKEANIIFSGLGIFDELNEQDLFDFFNYIRKHPLLAATHSVGQKIREIIHSWQMLMDFDKECYFHARSRSPNSCPYSDLEMLQAPTGITQHGRYNMPGESHFYFSDHRKGALFETSKHCSKTDIIQIARIKPTRHIKLFDLSDDNIGKKFLEYCRFPIDSSTVDFLRREYLIPSFVASCCKESNIDGIKYYGSQEYSNYVSWDDYYFEFIDHEIDATA